VQIVLYNVVVKAHANTVAQSVARQATLVTLTCAVFAQVTIICTRFTETIVVFELAICTGAVGGGVHREGQVASRALAAEIVDVSIALGAVLWTISEDVQAQVVVSNWSIDDVDAAIGSLHPESLGVRAVAGVVVGVVSVGVDALCADSGANLALVTVVTVAVDAVVRTVVVFI
jgi:hypothetical protein